MLSSSSGWLCYPGKLKPAAIRARPGGGAQWFRMALLSGEVETTRHRSPPFPSTGRFRMALLSGEVETHACRSTGSQRPLFRMALLSGEVETTIYQETVEGPLLVSDH